MEEKNNKKKRVRAGLNAIEGGERGAWGCLFTNLLFGADSYLCEKRSDDKLRRTVHGRRLFEGDEVWSGERATATVTRRSS